MPKGDIVRVSPDKLSFRTSGAIHDIYTDRQANMVKTGWTEASIRSNPFVNTHIMPDRHLHAARRRLLSNAFSEGAMKNLENYVVDRIRDWCNYIAEAPEQNQTKIDGEKDELSGWSKARDMGIWSTLLTVDVLGELCFGSSFDAMKNGHTFVMDLLLSSSKLNNIIAFLPIRNLIFPLIRTPAILFVTSNETLKHRFEYREKITGLVEKRFALEKSNNAEKAAGEQRRDFFHYLLHAKDPQTGAQFQSKDLVGEGSLLVGAGSDTSSTAMSACFFYLMRWPRAFKKLQDEVRSAFQHVEEIRHGPKLAGLLYLRACIDEAMRLSPPVPGLLDRKILPGGAVVDDHSLPEGVVVGVPIYAIHHSEKYFPRPFEFSPERWIAGVGIGVNTGPGSSPVTPEAVELAKAAFHPFSSGPRGCIGKNMAYMELLIAVGRAAWLFDIRLKHGDRTGEGRPGGEPGRERVGEYQLRDWLISGREGPVLEFRRREVET
ncbi:hypothetical protein A1O3_08616 [Capronia epimyces CBS 606.96]|uniref:Benzoate 4-monooxygenase n=1 Tax=Capronia epimyces CBS 606.96 TaxID=1182542 RepID=W9XP60_9EURO|nr:uncharacterized protein A1O3_08616 [Capronia epimyces CBS 606.96]EXJ79115.1 hypothetical protein A1O3_08616 [Capronia epimyces CBS 606.96]